LQKTNHFTTMSASVDEDEHSLEMHLPYIYKALSLSSPSASSFPPLIPILVGSTTPEKERLYGKLLAPYLADAENVFIISSDFCHWGSRFSYTYYLPASTSSPSSGLSLRSKDKHPTEPPIHESIARIDKLCMDAIESGSHDAFLKILRETNNTVCGRHPIGVVMAGMEVLRAEGKIEEGEGRFRFVRYERSNDCVRAGESSVSYASAFAVV